MSWLHRHFIVPIRRGPWSPSRVPLVAEYRRARRVFRDWEHWDAEQTFDYRLRALRATLRYCQQKVPYYREIFEQIGFDPHDEFTFDDFASLPTLQKQTVRHRGNDLLSDDSVLSRLYGQSTGGSTGEPVHVYLGPKDRAWRWAATDAMHERFGYRPGDRLALLWGTHLEPGGTDSVATSVSNWMINQRFFNCFRLDDDVFAQFHRDMNAYAPKFIRSYASALFLFARFLERKGIEPSYPSIALMTGAEKLTLEQRTLIEKVFRKPVFETYGARDFGLIAAQQTSGGAFIVVAPLVLVEPFGPTDAFGSREVVVTNLHPQSMPLVRYRIGDRAIFPAADNGCVYELQEITGRVLDHLLMPSGRLIHSTQFPHMLKDFDIVEYQVIQQANGSVDINLLPGPGFDGRQKRSLAAMVDHMIAEVPVRIIETKRIERTVAGKLNPVISHFGQTPPSTQVGASH